MKPSFIEDLIAAADDVIATITERRSTQGTHSQSTSGIDTALRRCSRARDVLDAFITAELHDHADLLATWRSMKRVGRVAPSRRKPLDHDVAIPLPQLSAPADVPSIDSARLLPIPLRQLPAGAQ